MINVTIINPKPVSVEIQENQSLSLSVSPISGMIKGKDAYSPFINEDGIWICWNDRESCWVNTGLRAQGPSGNPGEKGDPGTPGSDATVTESSIRSALGFMPVSALNHTHAYDSLTGKPQIPTVPVQDIQINGVSVLVSGVFNITRDTILALIDDGREIEY